jgi:CheY-like chemotaxis protein
MTEPLGFLSYTRKDDEFFGGYITAFRKALENAVHIVSGEERFRVFQDVEGIVIGEKWQKKLADAINRSSVLIPMLSPLFFNSQPCRDEVGLFLEHERELDRDDLILPVYFFASPRLEKEEERAKDALATELASRQMYDWREQANVPLGEPASRKAIVDLAGGVVEALQRLEAPAAPPATEPKAALPARPGAIADPRLGAGVAGEAKREALSTRTVLWVDDKPDNNRWERRALEGYGIRFELARDTDSALRMIADVGPFAAIVSDMGRPGDPQAGYTLLQRVRQANVATPYFIYTTVGMAATLASTAAREGAQGITGNPDALVEMVVAAVR